MPSHVVILGGTLIGARAARRLAQAGLDVTLLEPSAFLGNEVPRENSAWLPAVPEMLEALRDPRIHVLTQAALEGLRRVESGFQLDVVRTPRYVDPVRCTGCGECEAVCPVGPDPQGGRPHKAIYRDPAVRSIPNVYAIAKRGQAPCSYTCPGNIHVQGYVALIAQGKFREAHDLIAQAVPFPGVLGRVCYHPCEGQCNRLELDAPISVRALKRFVADYAAAHGGLHWERVEIDPALPPVAVVGAGPAGLTVAWELARAGVRVTVFEALPVAGGMLAVGIPAYRLPREVLRREIAALQELGIEIRLNTPLGAHLTVNDLFAQGYGAVFLGTGAHRSRRLDVPGEDLPGVVHAIDLLRMVCLAPEKATREELCAYLREHGLEIGRRAVVIGGGNSAVDVARTLLRLGVGEVRILYRRSRQEMPALPEEVRDAEEEGVILETLVAPRRILGERRVTALECQRMALGEPDASGRRRPVPIPGSEFMVETDLIVPAVGQEADTSCLPPGLCDERGRLIANPETGETCRPGLFAAGDLIQPASVIEAIGAAKKAAAAILRYLRGEEKPLPALGNEVVRFSPEELEERERQARQEPAMLRPVRRKRDFAEVERAFTAAQAVAEAGRCLSCGICSECLQCVAVCGPRAIDHAARPQHLTLETDAVLLAGGYTLSETEGVIPLEENTLEDTISALLESLGERLPQAEVPRWIPPATPALGNLGVFLCRCGEQIAGAIDLADLQARVAALPGVVRAEQIPFACLPEGIATLRQATIGLDGAVLAACSCCTLEHICYSCTSQRVRCREGLGVWNGGGDLPLPSWAWEYVNLREHCAWVHDPHEALEAAADLLAAATARLRVGPSVPLVAAVDLERCRTCGTCQTLCRAGAIRLQPDEDGRVRTLVEMERCLTCGTCAAHCPTGAIVAGRVSDRQVEVTMQALLGPQPDERILVFACNWGGHSGAEAAGMLRQELPAGVRVMRMPCLGRLSPGLLLRALELGAAGVLLLGCPEEGCGYEFGRDLAGEALAQAQALARMVGLNPARLGLAGIGLGDGKTFAREVRAFAGAVRARQGEKKEAVGRKK